MVTSALNFDTPDCHVSGSCDLYTTKAAGSDKKLYKNIQQSLESQHAALVKFGASLSPPQRNHMAANLNLSRSSPFGSLDEISNRRTFAYLIATLNASHPDYDFSQILRPSDFKRERNLRKAMAHIDNTLRSVRPGASAADSTFVDRAAVTATTASGADGGEAVVSYTTASVGTGGMATSPAWGPQMWAMIDKEMTLKDCSVFAYAPADDPFDEEQGAIWALHYFFFSKALKRVCYVYARGTPVMSCSPRGKGHHGSAALMRRRILGAGLGGGVAGSSGSGYKSSMGLVGAFDDDDTVGASKRARYWLGDKFAERIKTASDEEDEDDGLVWNRGDASDPTWYDEDEDEESFEDDDDELMGVDEEDEEDEEEEDVRGVRGRGVSEDLASRMEIDV